MENDLKVKSGTFFDSLSISKDRTVISMRDGILEYLGSEIDLEPADKTFLVYRSPATIANLANQIQGLPVVIDHIAEGREESERNSVSKILSSEIVDMPDESLKSTIGVKNKLLDSQAFKFAGNEMSLQYEADFKKSTMQDVDFEMENIVPEHLAVVENGRCGSNCRFLDSKKRLKMSKLFKDDGSVNIEAVANVVNDLPMAIQKLPLDQLQKMMPMLMQITSQFEEGVRSGEDDVSDQKTETDENQEGKTDENQGEKMQDEDEAKMQDEDEIKGKKYSDSQLQMAIEKAKKEAIEEVELAQKARKFLDSKYPVDGKSAAELMRAAVETKYQKGLFSEEELPTVFKAMQVEEKPKVFSDSQFTQSKSFIDLANQDY